VVEKERMGVRSAERGVSGRWGVDGTGWRGWHWMAWASQTASWICGRRCAELGLGPDLTDCTMARAARAARAASSSSECDGSI
jgi:hypothetical protein